MAPKQRFKAAVWGHKKDFLLKCKKMIEKLENIWEFDKINGTLFLLKKGELIMKSRYIIAGILVTAFAVSMFGGCGKKQEEESQTVSILYESNTEDRQSGDEQESGKESKDAEDTSAEGTKDSEDGENAENNTESEDRNAGETQDIVQPSDIPGDVVMPGEEMGPAAGNVGMGADTVIVDNTDTAEIELQLDDEDVMMLENMNFYVPLFEEDAAHDEAFQKEILKYGFLDGVNGGECVTLEDASGNKTEGYKVEESVAASYYKNLLGEDLTIQPAKPENFGEETPVYYEGGYYYIGVMPPQGVGFMYHRTYQVEDTVYAAFIMFDDIDTYRDYVFALEWADNENGFIVKAHYYDEQ